MQKGKKIFIGLGILLILAVVFSLCSEVSSKSEKPVEETISQKTTKKESIPLQALSKTAESDFRNLNLELVYSYPKEGFYIFYYSGDMDNFNLEALDMMSNNLKYAEKTGQLQIFTYTTMPNIQIFNKIDTMEQSGSTDRSFNLNKRMLEAFKQKPYFYMNSLEKYYRPGIGFIGQDRICSFKYDEIDGFASIRGKSTNWEWEDEPETNCNLNYWIKIFEELL
ncbi:MAG: hypothetical protein NC191_09640 [Muribaculaceae bacterium]|nr:hypothetical protein [Muribaculaceae bacterium]